MQHGECHCGRVPHASFLCEVLSVFCTIHKITLWYLKSDNPVVQ